MPKKKIKKTAMKQIDASGVSDKELLDFAEEILDEYLESISAQELMAIIGDRTVIFDMDRISSPENHKEELHGEISVIIRDEQEDIDKMNRAVEIMKQEALELTPRDTGLLQSAIRTGVEIRGPEIFGMVWYDIAAVVRGEDGQIKYALPVHDRPARHDRGNNPPRASWKFLYLAFLNEAIRQQIREILK